MDLQIVEAEVTGVQPGERAALVVELRPSPGGPAVAVPSGMAPPPPARPQACAFAEGMATADGVSVGLLDAALATWLGDRYGPLRAQPPGAQPCDGLPPVDRVAVPPEGRVIGVRSPGHDPAVSGDVHIHPIGDGGRWWHLHASGAGAVAITHGEDPPTRLRVRREEALIVPPTSGARTVAVPRGGATLVDLGGPITHAEVGAGDVARLEVVGATLVVLGGGTPGALAADAVVRVGDRAPEPLRIDIGAPPGPQTGEVRVGVGSKRRLSVDLDVRGTWLAAEGLAEIEVTDTRGGSRVTVKGVAPGRTVLVIDGGEAPLLVPIAIGG